MTNIDGIGNLHKVKEEFSFKFYKNFDVSNIINIVSKYNHEWLMDTSRQDTHDTHKNTYAYFIVEHDSAWKFGDRYDPKIVCQDEDLLNEIIPIIQDLAKYVDGIAGKVTLIKLVGNHDVLPHRDYGDYLGFVRRFHVPIQTNKDVLFVIDNNEQHMGVGECWEINNSKIHFVKNSSNDDRIHLLIDIMPSKVLRKEI